MLINLSSHKKASHRTSRRARVVLCRCVQNRTDVAAATRFGSISLVSHCERPHMRNFSLSVFPFRKVCYRGVQLSTSRGEPRQHPWKHRRWSRRRPQELQKSPNVVGEEVRKIASSSSFPRQTMCARGSFAHSIDGSTRRIDCSHCRSVCKASSGHHTFIPSKRKNQ